MTAISDSLVLYTSNSRYNTIILYWIFLGDFPCPSHWALYALLLVLLILFFFLRKITISNTINTKRHFLMKQMVFGVDKRSFQFKIWLYVLTTCWILLFLSKICSFRLVLHNTTLSHTGLYYCSFWVMTTTECFAFKCYHFQNFFWWIHRAHFKEMRSRSGSGVRLDRIMYVVEQTILKYQNPITGLFTNNVQVITNFIILSFGQRQHLISS